MPTILLTGATGYIGRRLERALRARQDLHLRLLVRNARKLTARTRLHCEVIEGDSFDPAVLERALHGVDAAYYLIHSMGTGRDFSQLDRTSAENFRSAAIAQGVRTIIYLGGLGLRDSASEHLASRMETGEILSSQPDRIRTLWFRAGVIIGAGSTSFEIIRHLVEKLPLMITPRWVKTLTQPIGVGDVIAYLVAALDLAPAGNLVIDIGAAPMRFLDMLRQTAAAMGLSRLIVPVPLLSPRLSSYWLTLLTPVPSKAMAELEHDLVISRWCDSSAGAVCDIPEEPNPGGAIFRDERRVAFAPIPADRVFRAILGLGGENGWFNYNILWRLRGLMDKLAGGYGLNRGRRAEQTLRVGDALDFWKVADIVPGKRLLLLAQMKLPGKAWLEFDLQCEELRQTAHFLPHGLAGRLYWYAVLPFHHFVFDDLCRGIIRKAAQMPDEPAPIDE